VVFFRSRRAEARELRAARAPRTENAALLEQQARAQRVADEAEDQEVLRELGAFEPEPAAVDDAHVRDDDDPGVLAPRSGAPKRA
jgi:hypothetical protein